MALVLSIAVGDTDQLGPGQWHHLYRRGLERQAEMRLKSGGGMKIIM